MSIFEMESTQVTRRPIVAIGSLADNRDFLAWLVRVGDVEMIRRGCSLCTVVGHSFDEACQPEFPPNSVSQKGSLMKITRTDAWSTVLDNYDPPRRFTSGTLDWTHNSQGTVTGILKGFAELRDAESSLYVLDDGKSARVMYVAGWSRRDERSEITAVGDNLWLNDFPVNPSGATRPDGRVIDFSTWQLGPRRTYHLKLSAPSFDTSEAFADRRVDRAGQRLRVGSRVRVWPYPDETRLDYTAIVVSFDFSEGSQAVLRPEHEGVRRIFADMEDLPSNLDRCELLHF